HRAADDRVRQRWAAIASAPTAGTVDGRAIEYDGDDPVKLFTTVHADRFVFARTQIPSPRPIQRGEALVVIAPSTRDSTVHVLTLDGQEVHVAPIDLLLAPIKGADPVPLKAAWLEVHDRDGHGRYGRADLEDVKTQGAALYGPPEFLKLAPNGDAGVLAFL